MTDYNSLIKIILRGLLNPTLQGHPELVSPLKFTLYYAVNGCPPAS